MDTQDLDRYVVKSEKVDQFRALMTYVEKKLETHEYTSIRAGILGDLIEPIDPMVTIAFGLAQHRQPESVLKLLNMRKIKYTYMTDKDWFVFTKTV